MNTSTPDMQAVVCHGPKDYRLERVARPRPGPNQLLIEIAACGICASDCKCYSGAAMFWGGNGKFQAMNFLVTWWKQARVPWNISMLLTARV